jgi:hypothetical protein
MSRKTTATHVLINQITIASLTESVTFSNIPQTYGDLVLVISSTLETFTSGNGKGSTVIRFNSDSGSNYTHVQMSEDVNGLLSTTGTQTYVDLLINSYEDDVNPTIYLVNIFDYSQADKHKTVLCRSNLATGNQYPRTSLNAYRWANTAAITSMNFFSLVSGGRYNPGTTFSLYGVVA